MAFKKVGQLEAQLQEYTDRAYLIDEKIAQHCAKILELSNDINNLEKEKAELALG